MPQILIVCTANICRSPVGEAVLRDRLQKRGLSDWVVRSAGTWAQVERGASRYSIQVLADRGLDLSSHRARLIENQHLQAADLVLCMEQGHVEALQAEFPAHKHKVHLLSEMAGKRYSIYDPYGQPLAAYQAMVDEITEIIDEGLERIITLAETNAVRS